MGVESEIACWKQLSRCIQAEVNGWKVEIDPFARRSPMSVSRLSRQDGFSVLALEPQPAHEFQPEEIYVREQDLIVRYAQSEADLYAIQLNWRLKPACPPFTLDIEIWISIQTRLLDTHPTIEFHSVGPSTWSRSTHSELSEQWSSDPLQSVDRAAAWLSVSKEASFLWMVDPGDQSEFTWGKVGSSHELQADLFGEFLEKGVIRRARCRFLAGTTNVNWQDVKSAYKDLIFSCLPITA